MLPRWFFRRFHTYKQKQHALGGAGGGVRDGADGRGRVCACEPSGWANGHRARARDACPAARGAGAWGSLDAPSLPAKEHTCAPTPAPDARAVLRVRAPRLGALRIAARR